MKGSSSPGTTRFITNKMCPYAQKAWIALEAKGSPYKLEEVSLYGPNGKPDWFWKLNPQGTVPILVTSDANGSQKIFPDSELILDHVADQLGQNNEVKNGNVQKWRDLVSQKIAPVGKRAVLQGKRKDLFDLLLKVDQEIVGPYLCGEELTVADCAAFPFLWRLDQEFGELNEADHQCGNIRKWIDQCKKNDAVRATIQSNWWWWW